MRILFACANSQDAYLDIEREHKELLGIARDGKHTLKILPAAEYDDLKQALEKKDNEEPFDVFHFAGHATEDKGIVLRGKGKSEDPVEGDRLKGLLADSGVKLVLLNACNSQKHARVISEFVPAIGTTEEVPDWAARKFTKNFYEALNTSFSAESAFSAATKKTKIYTRFPNTPFDIELPRSTNDTAEIEGEEDFYRLFYGRYFDEQIEVEKSAIRLGRWIFCGSVAAACVVVLWMLNSEGAVIRAALESTPESGSGFKNSFLTWLADTNIGRNIGRATAWVADTNIGTATVARAETMLNTELKPLERLLSLDKATPAIVMLLQTRIGSLWGPLTNKRVAGLQRLNEMLENWGNLHPKDQETVQAAVHNSLKESMSPAESPSIIESVSVNLSLGSKEQAAE